MRALLTLTSLACVAISPAFAQTPTVDPATGHYYMQVVTGGNFDWNQAVADAQATLWLGQPGHLVTIGDQAELDFILNNLNINHVWLGAFQNVNSPGYSEPGGGWEWITGEPWVFTSWGMFEPNNSGPGGGPEDFIEMIPCGDWNDVINPYQFTDAYLIEWDGGVGTNYCISTPNSSGAPATLTALGSSVVADQTLTLRTEPTPVDVFGIHYYGPNMITVPFGNGFRCVGGAIQRLPFSQAQGNLFVNDVDFSSPQAAGIVAGSTLNFQAWFRDQLDPFGYQLSDGLSILFQ